MCVCDCVCVSECFKATHRGHMLRDFPFSGDNVAHVPETVSLGVATQKDSGNDHALSLII